MSKPSIQERLSRLERREQALGQIVRDEVVRHDAHLAVLFGVALGFVNNIRAPGVDPGRNADMFIQVVEDLAGLDPADPASIERLKQIRMFGEKLADLAARRGAGR